MIKLNLKPIAMKYKTVIIINKTLCLYTEKTKNQTTNTMRRKIEYKSSA